MRKLSRLILFVAVLCGLALVPAIVNAQAATKKSTKAKSPKATSAASDTKLSDAVKKTFDEKFPNAKIEKVDLEKEGGVDVYDIEFREGRNHKETDIAGDGTMLQITVLVAKKAVPKEALRPMTKAAEGGKMARVEKVEITHETKDGKVVKLDKPKIQYAVEITKDDQTGEIVVDEKGKILEEPKWQAAKPKEGTKKPV